ncbi:MAG: hypothetical protein PVI86_15015 [Phycisphaerae bacterium]|jgi:hypothetical protein
MNDATRAAETYLEAARLNKDDPLLEGSMLVFPDYGQLVMTGDLHGHRRNFDKLKRYCDLERFAPRHVVLHEIIHEEIESLNAHDMSHLVLLETAAWKCDFPDQVHFLQSNHELAQINRHEITKNGRVVTMDFEDGVLETYGPAGNAVLDALGEFIRSFPLAGRTHNRVFVSHSVPSPRDLPSFDASVFSRVPTPEDLGERGSAHALVWGRYQTQPALQTLAELLDVDIFICGHQPQEMGYDVLHDRMLILASDHNHGVFLPFDLKKPITIDRLVDSIRPLAEIA